MFKRNARSAAALAMIGTLSAVSAMAQEATPEKLERIEVTGTRLKTISTESNSPVTSIGKAEIVSSQPVAVEEVVRSLPASYPSVGPGTNNGSGGLATVDLRGLGSNRTLVLFNGKRFVPSNLAGVVDTNNVPVALLERIDLLTGGASATYGADAVSGVVNFVMKKNFSGVDASTSYSVSEKGDAKRYKSDLTMGVNLDGGRGNMVLNVGTTRTDPLLQGQRDFGFYQLNSVTGARDGSSTAVPAIWAGLPAPLNGTRVIDSTSGLLRASTASDNYNFNPLNYYETPLKRTNVTALGSYKISDSAEVYAELFSVRSNVTLNLAPSGTFTSTYSIPIGNPYIPTAVRQQLCTALSISAANCVVGNATEFKASVRRRFTELGPRINTFDNTTNQYTVGVRGDVPFLSDWSYDAYYQSGRSDQVSGRINWGSFSKVQQALRSTNTTSCTNTANGCVPINIFGPEGSITPAMLKFINLSAYGTTRVQQQVTAGNLSGEVSAVKSPWARSPLNVAFGVEFREVNGGNSSDGATQTQGEVLGTGAPTPDRTGTIKFQEEYLEAGLPLINDVPGIKALNAELGFRQTNFKTATASQDYGSWKLGLDYTPFKGLRFRGQQQRATRAPNINELYQPVVTGLSNLATDPCQGNKITSADAGKAGTLTNLCQQTGVPANQIGLLTPPSAGQINTTSGGNPALGPEVATTQTLGLVWEPEFAKGLAVTLDWWKIRINKAVSSATTSQVLSGCFDPALNSGYAYNAFCQAVQRDTLSGSLNNGPGVVTQSSNLGKYTTSGVDLGATYRLALKEVGLPNWGRVELGLQVAYQGKYDFKSLPLDTVPNLPCAGYYGLDCGTPYSKTKFSQRTTWALGDFTVGYNWRHLSGVIEQPGGDDFLPEYSKIKAYDYVDLSGTWQMMKNLKLSLAINNAFNRQPPIVGNTIGGTGPNSGNTFPLTYDVIGRRYTVTLQATF